MFFQIVMKDQQIIYLLAHLYEIMPGRKIDQIRAFRGITGMCLLDAKDLVEAEHERRNPDLSVDRMIGRVRLRIHQRSLGVEKVA